MVTTLSGVPITLAAVISKEMHNVSRQYEMRIQRTNMECETHKSNTKIRQVFESLDLKMADFGSMLPPGKEASHAVSDA